MSELKELERHRGAVVLMAEDGAGTVVLNQVAGGCDWHVLPRFGLARRGRGSTEADARDAAEEALRKANFGDFV